jgi:Fe-S cluster biogenesis protein NfuA/nitrite reductase/ring-hydroxylating ferredoxin subunit
VEFDRAVAELNALVDTLEREGDERALLLLELVDAIHRPAFERLVAGRADDPLVQAVLGMYDLTEVEDRVRVEEALDEVRPYVEGHGGRVELLEVQDGVVHVRLGGACQGCAASAMTLRRGVEEALRRRYPAFREVVAHDPVPEPQLLQIDDLRRPVFLDAGRAADLAPGEIRGVDVDGAAVLLVNVFGEVYAFRNACPRDGSPLDGGRLAGAVLVCPWHNCAWDGRSGERLDEEEEPGLAAVPVALRDGVVQVAVNVA